MKTALAKRIGVATLVGALLLALQKMLGECKKTPKKYPNPKVVNMTEFGRQVGSQFQPRDAFVFQFRGARS